MQKTKDQKKELEERIKELEERANLNFYEIQRHLENLLRFEERTTAGFLEAEKRIAKLEHEPAISAPPKHDEQIKEIASSLEDRIRSIEDIVMLLELEIVKAKEKMEFVPGVPTRLEDQVRTIENKLGSIEKLKVGVPVELAAHEPRLQGLEDRILSLETKLKQETSRLEEILSERLVTEKTANEVGEKLHTEIQEIRRGIEKAEMLRFEITSREKDFAKKSEFESFTNFTHQELENLKDSVDRITASNTTLDRNLIKIEETLRSESDSHKKTFDTQLIKIEEKISDEIDSNKKNYDAQMAKIDKSLGEAVNREVSEVRILVDKAEAAKKRMETTIDNALKGLRSHVQSTVAKELSIFSEILDKKFPDLVNQSMFHELEQRMNRQINTIEVPNISPVVSRLDDLELRVVELASLLKTINNRMPLVVE